MENTQRIDYTIILIGLLKESSTFRKNLSIFLLGRNLKSDLEYEKYSSLPSNIADEVRRHLDEEQRVRVKDLSQDLFNIFNQPDWFAFTRVVQTMNKLPVPYPIDASRLSAYLKKLEFTSEYSIDLAKSSKAVIRKFNAEKVKLFGEGGELFSRVNWLLEEELTFKLWGAPLTPDTVATIVGSLKEIVNRIPEDRREGYLKLFAGILMACPLEDSDKLKVGKRMEKAIQQSSSDPPTSFYFYLLRYFIEDNVAGSSTLFEELARETSPENEKKLSDLCERLIKEKPLTLLRFVIRNDRHGFLEKFAEFVDEESMKHLVESNRDEISNLMKTLVRTRVASSNDLEPKIKWFENIDSNRNFYSRLRDELRSGNLVPRPGPGCFGKGGKRHSSKVCIDSMNGEDMTEKEKHHFVRSLFENIPTEHNDLYQLMNVVLNEASEGRNTGANWDKLFQMIPDLRLDSIDPEIQDILRDMMKNLGNTEKLLEILKISDAATKIQTVAERADLAFTMFLLGKHYGNGDVRSLGYDALNLWLLPKLGEKISTKLSGLGEKNNTRTTKGLPPVLAQTVGNFAAFLGLAEPIRASKDARAVVELENADLNIITNTVFVVASVGMISTIMTSAGIAAGTIAEVAGPIGWAVSIGVLSVSDFVEATLRLNKLSKQIKLTTYEEITLYWKYMWDRKLPEYMARDLEVEHIYKDYVSKVIDKFQHDYGMMAISLPNILVTKEQYATPLDTWDRIKVLFQKKCAAATRTTDRRIDFLPESFAIDPFIFQYLGHTSRLLPTQIQDFHLICGPRNDDVRMTIIKREDFASLPQHSCISEKTGRNVIMNRFTENWFIPVTSNGHCDNMVLYKNHTSEDFQRILFYLPQDSSITTINSHSMDVIFSGKSISVVDHGTDADASSSQSRYYFTKELDYCKIHKEGLNFIYIEHNGTFVCDLGGASARQTNIAVIQGYFEDIKNIHSIVGSEKSDLINVFHAEYVDGKGGGDTISVQKFTAVKSYYDDVIYGKTMTLLPMSVNEIHKIVAINRRMTVYNANDQFIQVDVGSFLKTNDGFLVSPVKIDNQTGAVTHLFVHKNVREDVVLENELYALNRMTNLNHNCTKQITSRNYNITLSDENHSIFYSDKNSRNLYWEGSDDKNHLYVLDSINVNVTISRAKGILYLSKFEDSEEQLRIVKQPDRSMSINIGDLHINLLKNRQPVKITFDGKQYFLVENGKLKPDYCYHSFKVDGRLIIDGQDLIDHHRCFEFPSDKVVFFEYNRHLLLLSGTNMLTITNFYPSVYESSNLSLKLNSTVVGPEEFRNKANRPNPFRFYTPNEDALKIYHNQPVDKDQIGVILLKNSSILHHSIVFRGDNLLLIDRNHSIVKLVDWSKRQAAREIMLAFSDTLVSNARCVLSNCDAGDILEEFQRQKNRVKSSKYDAPLDHSANRANRISGNPIPPKIAGNNTYDYANPLIHNVTLALLFLQNFLNKTYPLPWFCDTPREQIYSLAMNMTEQFEQKLNETSEEHGVPLKDWDSFNLYTGIVKNLTNEECLNNTFSSAVNQAFDGHDI